MNILAYAANQFRLAIKRRKLRGMDEWIAQLEDQVHSGQQAIRYWREKRNQLEAQILVMEPPDEIMRRSAAR